MSSTLFKSRIHNDPNDGLEPPCLPADDFLGGRESDIEESFVRSGGHGGQNVNKSATRVMLLHRPDHSDGLDWR